MNSAEWSQLQQVLNDRGEAIADSWYRAITQTSSVRYGAADVHRCLVELTEQVIALLLTETFDRGRAQAIGASLARLHNIQPEALGRTQKVLACQFAQGLSADQIVALQPRLAMLLGELAAGFFERARETILVEQEQIRQALITEMAQSEQALRALLNATNDVAVLIDTAGTILAINEIGARRRDKSVDELVGSCMYDFFPPHVAQGRKARVEQVIRSGKPTRIEGEYQGSFCDTNVYPVFDAQGEVARIAVFVRDVTERKRVEDALQESEERYRAISELASDFAYAIRIEPDGTLVCEWVTDAFTHITGLTLDELESRGGWESLIHPDDMPIALQCLQAGLGAQPGVGELRILSKAGEVRWLRIHSRATWDEAQGRVVRVIGAARDITEHKRMERSLLRANHLAAMGRLAAVLAHEINNPLQALRSGLSVLMNHHLEEEKRQRYLEVVGREVERLIAIMEQMLSFYRPSDGRREPTDVTAVLNEILALVRQQLQRGRVAVRCNLAVDLPPVEAVAAQLGQVFLNIILNALDAMPDGGELALETGWDSNSQEVWVSFIDTGEGIPAYEISRIFEPFYTTRSKGMGLGLAVSHSTVEQHGGRIKVVSQVSAGSTFTVFLPAAEASPDAKSGAKEV